MSSPATEATVGPSATSNCALLDPAALPGVDLAFQVPTGALTIATQVSEVRYLDGRVAAQPDPGEPYIEDLGNIRAGIAMSGTFADPDGQRVGIKAATIDGQMRLAGESTSRPLQISVVGDALRLTLPDIDADVTIDLVLSYQDDCFAYTAAAHGTATLGSRATLAACPASDDGILSYVSALTSKAVLVSGKKLELVVDGAEPRWIVGGYASDGPPLTGWDPEAPAIDAAAGHPIAVRSGNPDLTLIDVFVETYRRSDVLKDDVDAEPISQADGSHEADGTLAIKAPAEAGRYVDLLNLAWSGSCAIGGAFVIAPIDVG
ncbi:MAG TPA: hypothetical protein VGM49_07235 [Candidatus Limnocylindrales bacterium]|jgi:hypothetical protein